jgi:hypothetical protein
VLHKDLVGSASGAVSLLTPGRYRAADQTECDGRQHENVFCHGNQMASHKMFDGSPSRIHCALQALPSLHRGGVRCIFRVRVPSSMRRPALAAFLLPHVAKKLRLHRLLQRRQRSARCSAVLGSFGQLHHIALKSNAPAGASMPVWRRDDDAGPLSIRITPRDFFDQAMPRLATGALQAATTISKRKLSSCSSPTRFLQI